MQEKNCVSLPKVLLHQAVKQKLYFVMRLLNDRFGFVDLCSEIHFSIATRHMSTQAAGSIFIIFSAETATSAKDANLGSERKMSWLVSDVATLNNLYDRRSSFTYITYIWVYF